MNELEADLKTMEYLGNVVDICHFGYHLPIYFFFFFLQESAKFFPRTFDGKPLQLCRPGSLSHSYQLSIGAEKQP